MDEGKEEQGKTADGTQGNGPLGKPRQKSALKVGLGMSTLETGEAAPPFALAVNMLPAAQLNDAHRPETTYVLRDGLLSVVSEDDTMVIEASSGRLRQFTLRKAPDTTSAGTARQGKREEGRPRQEGRAGNSSHRFRSGRVSTGG